LLAVAVAVEMVVAVLVQAVFCTTQHKHLQLVVIL
jgi:hypothetical protein